jgi:hypothetical protein
MELTRRRARHAAGVSGSIFVSAFTCCLLPEIRKVASRSPSAVGDIVLHAVQRKNHKQHSLSWQEASLGLDKMTQAGAGFVSYHAAQLTFSR